MERRRQLAAAGRAAGYDFELRGTGYTRSPARCSRPHYLQASSPTTRRRPAAPDVVLVTDGLETCGGDPVAAAAASARRHQGQRDRLRHHDQSIRDGLKRHRRRGRTGSRLLRRQSATCRRPWRRSSPRHPRRESATAPTTTCNNIVDEGFPIGQVCNNGQQGLLPHRHLICDPTTPGQVCDAPFVTPTGEDLRQRHRRQLRRLIDEGCVAASEVCNGLDDDCDGTSRQRRSGRRRPCGTTSGLRGALTHWSAARCVRYRRGLARGLDGADNDCDCIIDQIVRECYDGAPPTAPSTRDHDFSCQASDRGQRARCRRSAPARAGVP